MNYSIEQVEMLMSSHLINLKKRMGFMSRRDIDAQKVLRLAD